MVYHWRLHLASVLLLFLFLFLYLPSSVLVLGWLFLSAQLSQLQCAYSSIIPVQGGVSSLGDTGLVLSYF